MNVNTEQAYFITANMKITCMSAENITKVLWFGGILVYHKILFKTVEENTLLKQQIEIGFHKRWR